MRASAGRQAHDQRAVPARRGAVRPALRRRRCCAGGACRPPCGVLLRVRCTSRGTARALLRACASHCASASAGAARSVTVTRSPALAAWSWAFGAEVLRAPRLPSARMASSRLGARLRLQGLGLRLQRASSAAVAHRAARARAGAADRVRRPAPAPPTRPARAPRARRDRRPALLARRAASATRPPARLECFEPLHRAASACTSSRSPSVRAL